VKLLTILERVDPKPVGVEELPVRAVVLTAYRNRSSGLSAGRSAGRTFHVHPFRRWLLTGRMPAIWSAT